MNFTSDPELLEMFGTELSERVERLIEGARAVQRSEVDDELTGSMLREGHTIKGTSRVMGFEAISKAGQSIEQLWRSIQHGETEPTPELGAALEELASALIPAVTADPVAGTSELRAAHARLTGDPAAMPAPAPGPPPAPPEPEPSPSSAEVSVEEAAPQPIPDAGIEDQARSAPSPRRDEAVSGSAPESTRLSAGPPRAELGGLLGALETWAAAETIPVNAGRLYRLINTVADLRNEIESLVAILTDGGDTGPSASSVAARIADLQREALVLPAVPLSGLVNSIPALVRYLAKKLDKDVRFEVLGDEGIAIDRQVVDLISDPVRQLIVNAVRHGVEPPQVRTRHGKSATGTVSLTVGVKDGQLELKVGDDGAGIDWELVRSEAIDRGLYEPAGGVDVDMLRPVLFSEGFATVTPSDLGGDGLGLHAVAQAVEALYGRVKVDTTAGVGTTVTLTVPTSRALQRIAIIEDGDLAWGLPEVVVDEVLPVGQAQVDHDGATAALEWHDRRLPLVSLGEVTGTGRKTEGTEAIIVSHRLGEAALTVSRVVGYREVAVKELGPLLSGPGHITGAALLGGGDVVLVLDPASIFAVSGSDEEAGAGPAVLVVDDSRGARTVVAGALASRGFHTQVASSVAEALDTMQAGGVDAVVVDFSMPKEDGIVLVDQVRARHGGLPVVMLSAVATPEDQERALRAGVDAFFEKADFREGALADTILRILDERGQPS